MAKKILPDIIKRAGASGQFSRQEIFAEIMSDAGLAELANLLGIDKVKAMIDATGAKGAVLGNALASTSTGSQGVSVFTPANDLSDLPTHFDEFGNPLSAEEFATLSGSGMSNKLLNDDNVTQNITMILDGEVLTRTVVKNLPREVEMSGAGGY